MRANLYTALALKAKVNLYLGKWQDAYNEADSVITSNKFSLLTDLSKVFLDGSNEAVWQVPIENASYGTSEAGYFLPYDSESIPNFVLTDSLINQFEPGDRRKASWVGVNDLDGQNVYFPAKYQDRAPTNLFTITNYKFGDPEQPGNFTAFPLQRIIAFGLNLKF